MAQTEARNHPMNRRNALITLSGAVAASLVGSAQRRPAFAQVPGRRLDAAEYRRMTLRGGSFALQTSQLALQQSVDPRVKEFAQFEINEQTAIAQVLLNSPAANPPPAPLDRTHEALLQSLRPLQGHAFDVAYIEGQLQGHQELLLIQQGFLTPPVLNRDLEHIAVLARMTIGMHITMLEGLHRAMPA
jgi:putative membrane protein